MTFFSILAARRHNRANEKPSPAVEWESLLGARIIRAAVVTDINPVEEVRSPPGPKLLLLIYVWSSFPFFFFSFARADDGFRVDKLPFFQEVLLSRNISAITGGTWRQISCLRKGEEVWMRRWLKHYAILDQRMSCWLLQVFSMILFYLFIFIHNLLSLPFTQYNE